MFASSLSSSYAINIFVFEPMITITSREHEIAGNCILKEHCGIIDKFSTQSSAKAFLSHSPALLTRISILSSVSMSVWAQFRTDFSDAKSNWWMVNCASLNCFLMSSAAFLAFSKLRQSSMTRAPFLAKSSAVSFPIPVLAPEIECRACSISLKFFSHLSQIGYCSTLE